MFVFGRLRQPPAATLYVPGTVNGTVNGGYSHKLSNNPSFRNPNHLHCEYTQSCHTLCVMAVYMAFMGKPTSSRNH